jgi:DNA end-binding protein Ku
VIRKKEHLACLRAYEGTLVLETMYYSDEVRNPERLDESENGRKASVRKEEVEMAKSLVESLTSSFNPDKYDDDYRKELIKLIRSKAKGKKLPEPEPEEECEVIDLMAALRESVKQSKRGRPRAKKAS